MASIDLLEKLKLSDYYPQKLSYRDATTLRGETQNGCSKKYGLDIVRKLLSFDSTAVVSVSKDINNSQNCTETEVQRTVDDVRPHWIRKATASERSDNAKQSELKLHPMDLLVVVMNCCDDFLRQSLVGNMVTNKLSIPILLPDVRSDSYTILNFALRSLEPEVHDRIQEISAYLGDTQFDVKYPVVSFIRVGNLHRSKSKLVNEMLNLNSFNTFFHRDCPNGSVKRSISNGSIEAAWFQSETASSEEFNCTFFTALNLRGDARDYQKQTQFLRQSSTLVVFMVDSFESFEELYEKVLKGFYLSQTKIVVCYISEKSPNNVDEKYFEYMGHLKSCGVISAVIYDWISDGERKRDYDFVCDLRETVSKFLEPLPSYILGTCSDFILVGKNFEFLIDTDKSEYETGKVCSREFLDYVSKQPLECKPTILPLQGEPLEKFGILEREQRRGQLNKHPDEHFIAEKETAKRHQRQIQCRSLIQQNSVIVNFFSKFTSFLPDQTLLYYLNCCKIKLDASSRVVISNITDEYKKMTHPNQTQLSNELEVTLSHMELKMANSVIGLEHIFRELGQMYEALISEENRMKWELKSTLLPSGVIRCFPTIMARLLLKGHPLELMDGDASYVPTTWLKSVINGIAIMTNNAKVFVLSIIGVQSSGKSTLLNALFGLQFPVSAGRCTRGLYCQLVPVDKESLHVDYDYVLVVDTEGLRAPQFAGKSTFRDNEIATFAIGLADATIINMKGENWTEMSSILQIVAHGLIRIRKTKAELNLMPSCMLVYQNASAVDAEDKNIFGHENQQRHLDREIKTAASAAGFTDINKFDDVIKFDQGSHSWYFPDLWIGRPPKARISQDYIKQANDLRQHIMDKMKDNPSKLTISSFFLRMSDLWNAMLHNDFVLCFRNTQEIVAGTVLNDNISEIINTFKNLNKCKQTQIRESICSHEGVHEFRAEKDKILNTMSEAVETNFANIETMLQNAIDAANICEALKENYKISLNTLKAGELHRTTDETKNDISLHIKKLVIKSEPGVKALQDRLDSLEKLSEEVEKSNLNEIATKEFEESWKHLIAENKILVDKRMKTMESEIVESIRGSIQKLSLKEALQLTDPDWADIVKTPLVDKRPKVTDNDIVQNRETTLGWAMDVVYMRFSTIGNFVCVANSKLKEACKRWELQFQNQRGFELDASRLQSVMSEVGNLLGILTEEPIEACPGADEIRSFLQAGYNFKSDYITKFVKFVCNSIFNRSLENSKIFISMTDPLADIDDRHIRSVKHYRLLTVEASVDFVSQEIFDYAKRAFCRDLGELIKTEVCKKENKNPTFKYKRAFLRTILQHLGQRTHNLTQVRGEKDMIFKEFLLYIRLGGSKKSKNFYLDVIVKLLKEMLAKEYTPETNFHKMVEDNVGKVVVKAKMALDHAETNCKGQAREYVRLFKEHMGVNNEIDVGISILDGFTQGVLQKLDHLYTAYLSKANSSFEALVCEENKAAIRPLFDKIMGCRERCPFCSAPCYQSLDGHAGDHRANHYPTGVRGTVEIWGLFANTQETHDATEKEQRKPRKLAISTCQVLVGTSTDIRTIATVNKYNTWFHRLFNWNYQSFKSLREIAAYKKWNIPHSKDPNTSLYWKWFMAQFGNELAMKYNALCPDIPELWMKVTWEEAKSSMDENDFDCYFDSEDAPDVRYTSMSRLLREDQDYT